MGRTSFVWFLLPNLQFVFPCLLCEEFLAHYLWLNSCKPQAYEQKQKALTQAASRRLRTSTYLRRSVLHATGRANREERTPEKGEKAERTKYMSREDVNELEVARHSPPFQGGD